jgi:multiubiquitin
MFEQDGILEGGCKRKETRMSTQEKEKEKSTTVVVNGREKTVTSKELTFDEVVNLAFDDPQPGPNIYFTITYRRGHGNKEGSLVEGESVKVKDGMIFNVIRTDKS